MPVPQNSAPIKSERKLLRDTVRDRIRDAIMDGTLAPGEDLNDHALQEWLGVSRTPIREAINELVRDGLIETSPNRYTRVAMPDYGNIVATFRTVAVIYGGIIRQSLPQMNDAQLRHLEGNLASYQSSFQANDAQGVRDSTLAVLASFEESCDNPVLLQIHRASFHGLAFAIKTESVFERFDLGKYAANVERFVAAVSARDTATAVAAFEAAFLLEPLSSPTSSE
ncbi:GntR family transcriptional regulator [Leucobacter japonicus]|uniref:GntR family transcriptional regulator n=1 Tax=Leucobacter japonicus TaxID=1461259 RepID=UPI0006A78FB0|nr:GntR family transcriptional regulator [Leucobacter japonicus]